MKTRFLMMTALVASLGIAGCADNSAKENFAKIEREAQGKTAEQDPAAQAASTEQADPHQFDELLKQIDTDDYPEIETAKPIITADGKTQIDWSQIDVKSVKKIDPAAFAYPFAKDSVPVSNYAKSFGISPEQAQLSMTLSMASPEVLGKLLDQLGGKYIAHSFRDGANPALVVQVAPGVITETHDYVIADKFGEGLVLPVELVSGK